MQSMVDGGDNEIIALPQGKSTFPPTPVLLVQAISKEIVPPPPRYTRSPSPVNGGGFIERLISTGNQFNVFPFAWGKGKRANCPKWENGFPK